MSEQSATPLGKLLDGAHALEDVVPIRRRVLILAAGLMVVELQMGLFLVFAELLPGLGARLRAGAGPDIAVRIPDRVLSGEATKVTKPIARRRRRSDQVPTHAT